MKAGVAVLGLLLAAQDPAPLDVKQITEKALKSVVVITYSGRDGAENGLGTGFVISPDGLIATNLHVIGEARPIKVHFADGKTYDVTSVHATERSVDLAIIRIDAEDLPALPLAEKRLPQGEQVVVLGNPKGLKHSVVTGVVSARREVDGVAMIQLAIPVEPGNSGGPVLDRRGRVHGIVTMKSTVTENLGFAVEIQALTPLIKKPNPIPMSRWLTIGRLDPEEWTSKYGARWRQRAGRIRVEGAGSGFGGRSICFSEATVPDLPYELAVNVRLEHDDGAAGLIFAADGGDKHYGFYPTSGSMRLTTFNGPTVFSWQIIQTVRSPYYRPGEWNLLKVRFEKEKIRCYVNGTLVIESDNDTYRQGKVGLAKFRHTHAEFKDFRVARKIHTDRPSGDAVRRIRELLEKTPTEGEFPAELIESLLKEKSSAPPVLREQARALEQRAERLRALARRVHEGRVQGELVKLLGREKGKIDLLRAALLVAWLDNEELDVEPYVREVDRMARRVGRKIGKDVPETERLEALDRAFFKELLFHGSRTDYYNRSNSYLNEVIDDREGLPITLSVLYMELGRRLGLKVVGVPLPGHFVVRFEPKKGKSVVIDVFDGGRRMSRKDAKEIVRSYSDALTDEDLEAATTEALKASPPRQIVARMLRNLMGTAKDEAGQLRYVDAILAFEADDPQMRARRIQLNMATGRYRRVIGDIDWFLEKRPPGLDADRVKVLRRQLEERLKLEE